MPDDIHGQLVAILMLWSLASLGSATVGLYAGANEFWRPFWLMSGIWGLIDGLIGWFALLGGPSPPGELLPILRLNAGLDVLYLVAAGVLLARRRPRLRGFGLGVLVQGGFLLGLDGFYWWRCAGVVG